MTKNGVFRLFTSSSILIIEDFLVRNTIFNRQYKRGVQ